MYSFTLSLTSALDGGGWSTPRPGRFTPGKDPVPIYIGGWVVPKAGLDGCEKSRPHRNSTSGPSSKYRVALPTELSQPMMRLMPYGNLRVKGPADDGKPLFM
jgi:rRNA maturation protein Nop10